MSNGSIFHPDFKARPFWWEAYEPAAAELTEVQKEARVAIIVAAMPGLQQRCSSPRTASMQWCSRRRSRALGRRPAMAAWCPAG